MGSPVLTPTSAGNPPKVAPGSNIATTVTSNGSTTFVYYQDTTGGILESRFDGRAWTGGASDPALMIQAAPYTPLAAINWDNGNQRRIYYLDKQYVVQEFCYEDEKWILGANFKSFPQASPHTSLSATYILGSNGLARIRVYYQTANSLNIQELCFGGVLPWTAGVVLPPALDGTSIAAETFYQVVVVIRLYCQLDDLTLHEYIWDDISARWTSGGFAPPGTAPARTPITTLGWFANSGPTQLVYWMNADRKFTQSVYSSLAARWDYDTTIMGGPLPSYTKVAACQANSGGTLRLYYQLRDTSILETRDDAGAGWGKATTVQAG